jgi:hypothetical protein
VALASSSSSTHAMSGCVQVHRTAWSGQLRVAAISSMPLPEARYRRTSRSSVVSAIAMMQSSRPNRVSLCAPFISKSVLSVVASRCRPGRSLGAGDERPSQIGPSAEKGAAPCDRYLRSAHDLIGDRMTEPSLPAGRGNDPDPSKTSPCLWCQHAEFIHAHDGPCLFSGCECPYFTSAEPGVVALR